MRIAFPGRAGRESRPQTTLGPGWAGHWGALGAKPETGTWPRSFASFTGLPACALGDHHEKINAELEHMMIKIKDTMPANSSISTGL
jgi:hypothetical protein